MKIFKIFILLFISSLLFSLSFPGFVFVNGAGIFAWFCFVPLFFALDRMKLEFSFVWGFIYGVLSYGLLVWWLYNYSLWIFILALVFYGFVNGILFVVLKLPSYGSPETAFITRTFILTSYEFIKTLGFFGFSYGVTGYTQWKNLPIMQISAFTGVYGVSFLLISCSSVIYSILNAFFEYKKLKKKIIVQNINRVWYAPSVASGVFVVLVLSSLIYGIVSLKKNQDTENIQILSVQHNENPYEDGVDVYANNITRLTRLTDEGLSLYPETKIVLWPETAVTPSIMYQYYNGKDSRRISIVTKLLEYMEGHDCAFVTGNFHAVPKDGTNVTDDYNAALVFVPKENVLPPKPGMYFKQRLVPLSEEFPFDDHFENLKNLMQNLGANFWCKGTENTVFSLDGFQFSTPICYEDTFPNICRGMVKNGSRCFMNLTNDSWGKSEACQNQHLSMAVFRSCENRVPTVRSATSGQSAVIDVKGRIIKEAPSFTGTFIAGEVPVIKDYHGTFYNKYGETFSYVVLFFSICLLLIDCIKGIIHLWQK